MKILVAKEAFNHFKKLFKTKKPAFKKAGFF